MGLDKSIPDAHDVMIPYGLYNTELEVDIANFGVEFAQIHVTLAVKAIKLKISAALEKQNIYLTDDWDFEKTGHDIIDEAYPLNNIKVNHKL